MEVTDYSISDDKSNKGVWVEHDGAKLKIRHFENEDFKNFMRKRVQTKQNLPSGLQSEDDITDEEAAEAIAKYLIVDWEGLEVNGEEVDYSQDLAKELILKTEIGKVILAYAQDYSLFREEQKELDLENL